MRFRWFICTTLTVLALLLPTAVAAQSPCGDSYVVKRGDRLSKIARSCGTTVKDILAKNPSIRNPNVIYPGKKIILPRPAGMPGPAISLEPNTGSPGSVVEITVSNVPTGTMVDIGIGKKDDLVTPVKTVYSGEKDSFETRLTIPAPAGRDEAWIISASSTDPIKGFTISSEFLVVDNDDRAATIETNESTSRITSAPDQAGPPGIVNESDTPDKSEATSGPGLIGLPVASSYTVQRGDTMGRIASRFGVPLGVLIRVNPQVKNPRLIYVGQTLNIPPPAQVQDILAGKIEDNPALAGVLEKIGEDERWIDVDLTLQRAYAFEGNQLAHSFVVSTGRANTPTVTGQYNIWIKLRYDDMRGPGYHLKNVPYVMYFYKGYGLHGTYWHNNFGTPMSNGCVNFSVEDAAWLFDFAEVGTLVSVHY